jgi:protein-histidine N-methyltransferase
MGQGEAEQAGTEKEVDSRYIDADTDLIPGQYEGGLKTWEGGVDLVEVLAEYDRKTKRLVERIREKRVIEVSLF